MRRVVGSCARPWLNEGNFVAIRGKVQERSAAHHKDVGVEEGPRDCDAAQKIVSNTDSTALDDGQRTRLDARGHLQLVMSPDDGLNQLLPVAAATEEEHQAESPDEVTTKEHDSVAGCVGAVAVDHLNGLSPQEITQPTVDGDGAVGEIAIGEVLD